MSNSVLSTIPVEKVSASRLPSVDFDNLKFGQILSDHMLVADYQDGKWGESKIVPYSEFTIQPSISALHYGQSIFEGIKAFRYEDGSVNIFRPDQNFARFNRSAVRMCMPEVPESIFLEGMKQLIALDREWVPKKEGCSLYIRPFMFATEAALGVHPSNSYRFAILTGPVGVYYSKPLRLKVETQYSRAAEGGVGFAKCAGNYALSLYPTKLAQQEGYDQLMWTDSINHEYIEEAGTANLVFRIGDTLITPHSDTILHGITRKTIVEIAQHWGLKVEQRRVKVSELLDGIKSGIVTEAFAAGTAVTLSHIAEIGYNGQVYTLPDSSTREFSNKVLAYLNDLRYGRVKDEFGWNHVV